MGSYKGAGIRKEGHEYGGENYIRDVFVTRHSKGCFFSSAHSAYLYRLTVHRPFLVRI